LLDQLADSGNDIDAAAGLPSWDTTLLPVNVA
jgi:hypothetical protein